VLRSPVESAPVPGGRVRGPPVYGSWLPVELTFVGSCCLRGAFGAVADAAQHAVLHDEVQRLDGVPQPGLGGTVGKTLPHEQPGVSAARRAARGPTATSMSHARVRECLRRSRGTSGCAGVRAPINTRWCGGSTSMTCEHTCLSRPERRSRTCRSQCLHRPAQAVAGGATGRTGDGPR
jgi:hypothetical protein